MEEVQPRRLLASKFILPQAHKWTFAECLLDKNLLPEGLARLTGTSANDKFGRDFDDLRWVVIPFLVLYLLIQCLY